MAALALFSIMTWIAIIIFLGLLPLVLIVIALIDIFRSKFTGNNQLLMVLIVLLIPYGAILYYFLIPSVKIGNTR